MPNCTAMHVQSGVDRSVEPAALLRTKKCRFARGLLPGHTLEARAAPSCTLGGTAQQSHPASDLPVQALLNTHYTYQQGRIACKLRAALTCMVFKKTLLVSASDMAAFSSGAVQTLMSVDADRVVNVCASFHELWSLPAQICIALYLLWTQVPHLLVFLSVHQRCHDLPS